MTDPDVDKLDDRQDGLGERVAKLEGKIETEDRLVERGLESARHGQMLLIGISAVVITAAIAMLIYILQRLDSLHR